MRGLRRPRIAPPTLCRGGKGGDQALAHRRAREEDAAAVLKFPEHWTAPDVRGALYAMHGWVCAYCQDELTHSDRGDVEHFRPKSLDAGGELQVYWWLAYAFDNYFLACRRCNSPCKSNRFPLAPASLHVRHADRAQLGSEARLLVDPVADPVEQWIRVVWFEDDDAPELTLGEGLRVGSIEHARTTETIAFFKLSTDPHLVYRRNQRIEEACKCYRNYRDGVAADENREELQRLASRFRPHGVAVRNLVEQWAPSLLPTEVDELVWLLDDIGERLKPALRLLAVDVDDPDYAQRDLDELFFALATLWKDPPGGHDGRSVVDAWLEEYGLTERVAAEAAKLGDPSPPSSRRPQALAGASELAEVSL